ncbi:MAG: NUDIX hydrolase [Waddliaceae bacterium]
MKSSVTSIIFQDNYSKVLIIKRCDVPIWVLPGGSIDKDETPETAVTREVLEETGLEVSIKRKVAVYTPVNRLTTSTHVFECETHKGNLKTGKETKDIGFFPLNALPDNTFHVHMDMIQDALLKKKEVIRKPFTQITYWKLFKYFVTHPILVIRFTLSQMGFPINS